jgi:PilZ domain
MDLAGDGGRLAERRAHRRVLFSANAELHDGERVRSGNCSDLSLGGMGLSSDAAPSVGSEVEVRFDLGSGRVSALGQVVRSENGRVGLRFVRLDQHALTSILGAVARA